MRLIHCLRPLLLLVPIAVFAPAARAANSGSVIAIGAEGFRIPLLTVTQADSGALVIFADTKTGGVELYAQRLDRRGRQLLGDVGTYLMPYDPGGSFSAIPDGAGGAIMVQEAAGGANDRDIVAWRVMPDGSMGYGANGIAVCNAPRDQTRPRLVGGPAGFFYVAWDDDRPAISGRLDIYAQRMSIAGVPQWTANGILLNTAGFRPWSYGISEVASDLQGGFLITWTYNSFGGVTRAQRVSSTGALSWTVSGVDFGHASGGASNLSADGFGGAWGTYADWNGTTSTPYAYHMAANGSPAFAGGVQFLAPAYTVHPALIRTASGGCFLYAAVLGNSSQTTPYLYIQELSAAGALLRGTSGEYYGAGQRPGIVDAGSYYFTVTQENTLIPPRTRIRIQKHGFDGSTLWPGPGVALGRSKGSWYNPAPGAQLHAGASGVVTTCWVDTRYASPWNTSAIHGFGQAFDAAGNVLWEDSEAPELLTAADAVGDQGGRVRVTWSPSVADHPGARSAAGYRVWRALPASAMTELARVRPLADGMFRLGDRTLLARAGSFWELAGEQPAATLPGYALAVTTGMDSTAGSPADHEFMVEAFDDSSHHWFSGTRTAHSVDNLAPGMVPSAAGFFSGGVTSLYWGGVPDGDLLRYEVFRGSTPGFTPGDANRIAVTTNVTWQDPFGSPAVYRIAARDIHGNLGPSALVIPTGTLAADAPGPREWRLLATSTAGELRLSLDVPGAEHGHVDVFDVTGRRVWGTGFRTEFARTLAFRPSPAALPAGVLFVRATTAAGRELTRRVTVMR